ncbi:MAG: alanine racemase [Paenibacillaceae bacterium]|nr:alanine racemase [Paenibacillaceae bacterium]
MHIPSSRNTWATISLAAIAANTRRFRSLLGAGTRLMAVVKADGYGHGAVQAALSAQRAGADCFGVAIVDEALRLREAGIAQPILVLGYTPPRAAELAVRHDIALTVCSEDTLDGILEAAERLDRQAVIHLKLETGMGRLGATTADQALALIRKAKQSKRVAVEGVFTHLASADAENPVYSMRQFRLFQSMVGELEAAGEHIPLRHVCNSAGTIRFPHMHLGMVRVGIGLYGLSPFGCGAFDDHADAAFGRCVSFAAGLQPAMSLRTRIAAVTAYAAGQPIGYSGTFRTARPSRIAVLPIGYADGLRRGLSNRGAALVRGMRAPIVGNVCMDQTMLDVTGVPGAQSGDEAVLFGADDTGGALPCDEMAAQLGTIHYEVVCAVGARVPRVYDHADPVATGCTDAHLHKTGGMG